MVNEVAYFFEVPFALRFARKRAKNTKGRFQKAGFPWWYLFTKTRIYQWRHATVRGSNPRKNTTKSYGGRVYSASSKLQQPFSNLRKPLLRVEVGSRAMRSW